MGWRNYRKKRGKLLGDLLSRDGNYKSHWGRFEKQDLGWKWGWIRRCTEQYSCKDLGDNSWSRRPRVNGSGHLRGGPATCDRAEKLPMKELLVVLWCSGPSSVFISLGGNRRRALALVSPQKSWPGRVPDSTREAWAPQKAGKRGALCKRWANEYTFMFSFELKCGRYVWKKGLGLHHLISVFYYAAAEVWD